MRLSDDVIMPFLHDLRTHDYANYLTIILQEKPLIPHHTVLASWCRDIARIPFQNKEPMLARIRLQWWRDHFLDAKQNPDMDPPTTASLEKIMAYWVRCTPEIVPHLIAILDAKELEITPYPFATKSSYLHYCNDNYGQFYHLNCLINQQPIDALPLEQMSYFTGTIQALWHGAFLHHHQQCFFDQESLSQLGISAELFASQQFPEENRRVVHQILRDNDALYHDVIRPMLLPLKRPIKRSLLPFYTSYLKQCLMMEAINQHQGPFELGPFLPLEERHPWLFFLYIRWIYWGDRWKR
jgi:hypothetical protein